MLDRAFNQLLADSAITKVISVSRKSLNISKAKLTEVPVSDLAELLAIESKHRGDLYFCCLGMTIKTAGSKENFEKVDRAAKSFTLVSGMGANVSSLFFFNQIKGRTAKGLGFRSLIIFRAALLVGLRQEFRVAASIATNTLVPLSKRLPTRSQKSLVTKAESPAARMLAEGKVALGGVHVIPTKDI